MNDFFLLKDTVLYENIRNCPYCSLLCMLLVFFKRDNNNFILAKHISKTVQIIITRLLVTRLLFIKQGVKSNEHGCHCHVKQISIGQLQEQML